MNYFPDSVLVLVYEVDLPGDGRSLIPEILVASFSQCGFHCKECRH